MNIIPTSIPDVLIIEPKIFGDARGFFYESYNRRVMTEAGIPDDFVQDNHSRSAKGVLRGLHYQIQNTQGKLVRVISGSVYDVAVDLRKSSPTFGRWVGIELSADNRKLSGRISETKLFSLYGKHLFRRSGFNHPFTYSGPAGRLRHRTFSYRLDRDSIADCAHGAWYHIFDTLVPSF